MKIKQVLLVILAIIAGVYFYNKDQKKQEFKNALQEIEDERMKYRGTENAKSYLSNDEIAYAAQQFVEKYLKSPSTAEFPELFKSTVTKKGSDTYYISSYVDSENGFGAMIRSNYVVELKLKADGEISLVDLNISQ